MSSAKPSVDSIRIDPELWLLSKNNTVTEISTSSFDPLAQATYAVFPNPAKDFIEVLPVEGISSAECIDVVGKEWKATLTNGRIDIRFIPAGFYSLVLRNADRDVLSVQSIIISR